MKSVSLTLIAQVTSDQYRRLCRIDAEDFTLIAKKVAEDFKKLGVVVTQEYLDTGIYALKQYYAVAMLDPANAHAVTVPIDPFWHAHILFTAQYREFCADVVGEYMDHVPLNFDEQDEVKNVGQLYSYTLTIMPKLFDRIDEKFWPSQFSQADLICYHKGNSSIYLDLQADRLFEPAPEGQAWAYS